MQHEPFDREPCQDHAAGQHARGSFVAGLDLPLPRVGAIGGRECLHVFGVIVRGEFYLRLYLASGL
jgi:hypothetical protein